MYELRFDEDAIRVYKKAQVNLARRLNRCFEHLRENPFSHPNIKLFIYPLPLTKE